MERPEMNTLDLYQLMEAPQQPLSPSQLDELRRRVDECPFHQTARLLYVAALYQAHSPLFGEELRKASLLVPQPAALMHLIEGKPNSLPPQPDDTPRILTEDDDRTATLIDHFLAETPKENDEQDTAEDPPRALPTLTDVTSDYAAFLAQQPDANAQQDGQGADEDGTSSLIEQFIASTQGRQRYQLDNEALDNETTPPAPLNPTEGEQLYNERIVDLLIRQGNYQQALQILRQLCEEYPQKNLTFAARLRLLEAVTAQEAKQ